jgi:hypothetical protein
MFGLNSVCLTIGRSDAGIQIDVYLDFLGYCDFLHLLHAALLRVDGPCFSVIQLKLGG